MSETTAKKDRKINLPYATRPNNPCKTCEFWSDVRLAPDNSQMGDCRWGPPTPMLLPQQHPITGQTTMGHASVVPKTGADFFCFRHEAKLEVASDA